MITPGSKEVFDWALSDEDIARLSDGRATADQLRLERAARKSLKLLWSLQPHIPQACMKGHEKFIDNYVDLVMHILEDALKVPPEKQKPGRSKLGKDFWK